MRRREFVLSLAVILLIPGVVLGGGDVDAEQSTHEVISATSHSGLTNGQLAYDDDSGSPAVVDVEACDSNEQYCTGGASISVQFNLSTSLGEEQSFHLTARFDVSLAADIQTPAYQLEYYNQTTTEWQTLYSDSIESTFDFNYTLTSSGHDSQGQVLVRLSASHESNQRMRTISISVWELGVFGITEPPQEPEDSDGDGVVDDSDDCPNTTSGAAVDAMGCSDSQRDSDADGVTDDVDSCDSTPEGQSVDANGCAESQKDDDDDGVTNDVDQCPESEIGATVNSTGCVEAGPGPQPDDNSTDDSSTNGSAQNATNQSEIGDEPSDQNPAESNNSGSENITAGSFSDLVSDRLISYALRWAAFIFACGILFLLMSRLRGRKKEQERERERAIIGEHTDIPERVRSDSDLRSRLGESCMHYIEHKKWNDDEEVALIEQERANHTDAKMTLRIVVPASLPPEKPKGYVKGVVDGIRESLSAFSPSGEGGTTDYHITGSWRPEGEPIVIERGLLIESSIPMEGWKQHAEEIRLIIRNTQRKLQQQCMAYSFEHLPLQISSLVPEDEVNCYPKFSGNPDPDILNEGLEDSPSKPEAIINIEKMSIKVDGDIVETKIVNIHNYSERQQTDSQKNREDPPSSVEEPKPDTEWLSINLEGAIKQIDDDEVQEALADLQSGYNKSAQISSHQFIHMVFIARCHELLDESQELKRAYGDVRSIAAHLLPDDTVEQVIHLIRLWDDPRRITNEDIEHWTTEPDPGLDFEGSQLISRGERNLFIGRTLLRQPVLFDIDNQQKKALSALLIAREHGSPRFRGFADVTIRDDGLEGGPHLEALKDLATNTSHPRIVHNDALTAWFAAEFIVDEERCLELFEQYHGQMDRTRPQRRLQFYNNHLHHMSISQSFGPHQQKSESSRLLDRILSKTDDDFKSSPLTDEHRFLIVTMMDCAIGLGSDEHIERVRPLVDRLEVEFDTLPSYMKVELICIRGELAHRSGEKGVVEDCRKEMNRIRKRAEGTSTQDENLETEMRIERFKKRIGMEEE